MSKTDVSNNPIILTPDLPDTAESHQDIDLAEAEKHLTLVRQYCVSKLPSLASLSTYIKHKVLPPDDQRFHCVAFTDGSIIGYGNIFFEEQIKAQAAIVTHEILHVALRHPQRAFVLSKQHGYKYGGDNFDARVWNLAADCIVNLSVFSLRWVEMPSCGCVAFHDLLDPGTLKQWPEHTWSVEKLYHKLMDTRDSDPVLGFIGRVASGSSSKLLDDVVLGSGSVVPDTPEEARNWGRRLERAAAGELSSGALRKVLFDNQKTDTPWQTILRRHVSHAVMPTTTVDLSRPSRAVLSKTKAASIFNPSWRIPYDPGKMPGMGIKRIVVCVDTSGSISDKVIAEFCCEINSIRQRTGAEVVVIFADAKVGSVAYVKQNDSLESAIAKAGGVTGGGGTCFIPAVEMANTIKDASVIVYLTDMMGNFPTSSRLPLIWAATHEPATQPPCGKVIRIK